MAFRRDNETWNKKHSQSFLIFPFHCSSLLVILKRGVKPVHPSSPPFLVHRSRHRASQGQLAIQHDVHGRDASLLTISGSITQSQTSLTGEVHVEGSSCFDQRTAIALTGTLSNGSMSLTSTAVDGQIFILSGSITKKIGFPDSLTGTFAINGGC